MAIQDEQKLKDLLRSIETGDIPEDLDLPDPEEYEDEGGIRSLNQKTKVASETPEEEFELELNSMLEQFKEAVKNGYKGSLEEFSKWYFSQRNKAPSIKMAANGGRMQYAEAGRAYEEVIDKGAEEEYYEAKAEQLDRKYNPQNYPESERNLSVEQLKKMLKKQKEEQAKKAKGGIAGVL